MTLTRQEHSELVCRNGHHRGLCAARLGLLGLQPKLDGGLVHFLQLAGTQRLVNPPGHGLQTPHWETHR